MPNNSLTVPIAIIIAGAFVAIALFFGGGSQRDKPEQVPVAEANIEIPPVDSSDHIVGNPGADVVFIEFSDTECPFCKTFHETMNQIMAEYGKDGKVAWVFRHFPLWKPNPGGRALHPRAEKEAQATECANELGGNAKFWEYVNKLFEITPSNNGLDPAELPKIAKLVGLNETAFNTCLESNKYAVEVEKDYQIALKAGARGTPTSVILLKKEANKNIEDFISATLSETKLPKENLFISSDKRKIFMSGAFPHAFVKQFIDLALGS